MKKRPQDIKGIMRDILKTRNSVNFNKNYYLAEKNLCALLHHASLKIDFHFQHNKQRTNLIDIVINMERMNVFNNLLVPSDSKLENPRSTSLFMLTAIEG